MEDTTQKHLAAAARHRQLSYSLFALRDRITPSPVEWVAVIAFYAAVHFVNAYLWEAHSRLPSNHSERGREVRADPALRQIQVSYDLLRHRAWSARYDSIPRLSADDVQRALDALEDVTGVVARTLGAQL